MSMKDIFKQRFEAPEILVTWEPIKLQTKQQKYARVITNCLQLEIKIPIEMLEEYNKTIKE